MYAVLVWFGAAMVVSGTNYFLVVFVLLTLGLTVLIVYLLISRAQPSAQARGVVGGIGQENEKTAAVRPASGDDPEVAALGSLIAEANTRLAKSPKLASRRVKTTVTRLPLFILGGTEGGGKTSVFLKSGLEPELLAGQVFRDTSIVPTRLANLWFAEDSLFAEVSGGLFSGDPGRWCGVLSASSGKIRRRISEAIFGGKGDAQLRGFVLFCDIAPFLGVPDPSRMGGLSAAASRNGCASWANPLARISRYTSSLPRATDPLLFRIFCPAGGERRSAGSGMFFARGSAGRAPRRRGLRRG